MAGNIKGITIEIGGDTTKLDRALKDVNKNSRDLNRELKDVEKSLKFNPGNTELLAQKQRVLGESVENTKKKLETLKEAQEQAAEALARGDIGQDEYDALTREVIKTENQLKSLQGELDKTNNKWKDVGEKLQTTGEKMTKVGEGMTKGVTAPIAAAAGLSVAAFNEVDAGLDTVISKTGATGEAAKGLEESFRNVASNMPASFDEVGNAIGEINTQFGLTGENLEKASEKMIKFAQINDADVTASTIGAKQAIEKYGLSAKDLDMVLDVVTKTAQNTGVSTDKLFDAVTKGSPQLRQLGLDFAQATEMMGRMEQKGIDSNKALSYLTRAQTNWAKEGKSVTQGLQEMQDKMASATTHEEKLAIAAEAFGTKGGAFMLEVLESGALNADEFANAMEDAAGSVDSTWEGMLDPIDLVKQAMNNLKLTGADLGASLQTVLLPMLENAIGALKKFADWFGNLTPETQEFIVKIGLIAAAIGPVLVGMGKLAMTVGKAMVFFGEGGAGAGLFAKAIAFITGPAGLVVAAIAAIIAIGVLLYKNWDTVKERAHEIWSSLVDYFTGIWDGVSEAWTAFWDGIKTVLSTLWQSIKDVATGAFNGIAAVIGGVWNVVKALTIAEWNGIKTVVTTVWNAIKTVAAKIFEAIKGVIDKVWNAIKSASSSVWNAIKSAVTAIWNGLKVVATAVFNAIKAVIETAWNAIKGVTTSTWNGIKSTLSGVWNGIKASATAIFNGIKAAIETAWNTVKNTTSSIWNGIKSTLSGIWNGIKSTVSAAANAVKSQVTNVWNQIKSTTGSIWNGIKGAIERPINAAKGAVERAISRMKSVLSGTMPFPHIRLPHFRVSGSFSLNPPSVPSFGVSWYDKGGIFKSPTVIGVGEKRPEFVGALDDLKAIVAEVLDKKGVGQGGGVLITGNTFMVREEADIKRIAQELDKLQQKTNRSRGMVTT